MSQVAGASLVHDGRAGLGRAWRAIIFGTTLFFFSNVAVHGFLYGGWPVRPSALFVLTVVALTPFIYARSGLSVFLSPLAYWCVAFVALAVIWFVLFGGSSLPSVLGRCYAALFLLFFFALFSMHADAVKPARKALACGVLVAAACNAYEVLNPTAFLPEGEFYGRAAGFYVNPNQCGAAIVLGTVLGLGVVPVRYRALFLSVGFAAIALTLSRAAVLGLGVAVLVLVVSGALRIRTVLFAVGAFGVSAYAAWQLLAEYLLVSGGINLELLEERIGFFTAVNAIPDASQIERASVAEKAWMMFENSILLGNGLGSTETWSESASTHNMYLYFMADYGLSGAVLYPALILVCAATGNRMVRPYALAFAGFAGAWGLFSHNIVGELYSLISFAAIAAWTRTNASAVSGAGRRPHPDRRTV